MKKSIISFICGALSMAVFGGGAVAFASGAWKTINVLENDISVVVDGIRVNESNFLYNDTTYLPLRAVAEAVGKEVTYDERTNTAYIGKIPSALKKSHYYTGFDVNIPDYSAITGVPLKERYDPEKGNSLLFYEYTNESDIFVYIQALEYEGFKYLGDYEEANQSIYCKGNVYVGIDPYTSDFAGHIGDLSIMIITME